jgi:hypothetical protein
MNLFTITKLTAWIYWFVTNQRSEEQRLTLYLILYAML